jgi:formylglycine-generating enzyme required for sulfatase activity
MAADVGRATGDEPTARVFISYSRKDLAFADRLDVALKARGFEPLIDRTEIYAFEDWWQRIQALIGRADTVVFVLSPDAVASEVALKEVAHAASLNKRFAPIVYRRVEAGAVPETLRRLNFIFFDDPAHFDASLDQLAVALQTDIGWIRRHTEFGEAARRWIENDRPAGLLLRPPLLDQAETWVALRPIGAPSPTIETEHYLAESRKADAENRIAEAKAKTRWRRAQVAIYVLLVGIIVSLVGIIEKDPIKEQINWFTVVRPYRVANFDPYVLTHDAERALKPLASFRECAEDCPEMVVIPAGGFTMGSPTTERDRASNEGPQHKIRIAKPFAVSKYDVTFADWDACVSVGGCPKATDSGFGRSTRPVINVGWDDAQTYVAWLSTMTGQPYRLLTEAEWEYAARAGTTTAYYWGDEIGKGNANCNGCGSQWDAQQTSPVGWFAANQFGLYDMAGNVFQWVQDCKHPGYNGAPTDGSAWNSGDCSNHVVRGGSWGFVPGFLRAADRNWGTTGDRANVVGFRVGRTLITP